jgi:ADP-ribose pyrophosphatase
MSRPLHAQGELLADRSIEVALSTPQLLCKGFRDYERFKFTVAGEDGALTQTRDVLRFGRVAAVLPFDPARDEIVVIRQFRLPAHLANGHGDLIEIVAGHVEAGEQPPQTARRECMEEIAVEPKLLIELFTYLSTPGITDEEITLFLGIVDSSKLPERAGAASEGEVTRPLAVPIDTALAALAGATIRNGPLIIALQWLALNRGRLREIVRQGSARP